jgi:mRNA interferase MazF
MKQPGQIVLLKFPQTNLETGKLRPALLLGKLPGEYDDWLICMVSSQTYRAISGFDEVIREDDADFGDSGLKASSVIRVGRLAVVQGEILLGAIGQIAPERLERIKRHLAEWLFRSSSGQ